MSINMKNVASINALAGTLPDLIGKLDGEMKNIAGRMVALKKDGLIYAGEHMKDGKYLVLLHPSQTGEARRREYVGKDPQKIQEARDAIRRAKDYDALAKQYERLELIVTHGYRNLQEAARTLSTRTL